ncbi:MAG: hypothetical protein Ct9H300mP21_07540 [Pseudomonadota bacterium]|nr:MAG: hypothetical protein Ct9H300mP21_07540 [Pseudomonadota bacterium]
MSTNNIIPARREKLIEFRVLFLKQEKFFVQLRLRGFPSKIQNKVTIRATFPNTHYIVMPMLPLPAQDVNF